MSRFSSPEAVKAWAMKAATADYQKHTAYGVSLNPYFTIGAREDWQRGFDGLGCRSYEVSVEYDTMYQRGAAARIVKTQEEAKCASKLPVRLHRP